MITTLMIDRKKTMGLTYKKGEFIIMIKRLAPKTTKLSLSNGVCVFF